MAKDMMTITISDTVIRLMVTDGKHVTDWAELPFDSGLIDGNLVVEPDAVAAKINQLLEIKSVDVKKVLLGIGGMRCLTRPIQLPKLPKEILDEAVRREAERLLPVPLNELYMSWQTIPSPDNQTQVFLTAIPRRIVDSLMQTLDKAGLKPLFMDLKPLLLARVCTEETAILVDIQELDFDIVVMVKGVPQPIRTVPFRGENPPLEEKLIVIREELDRTITFYNGNHTESAIENDLPVHVSGDIVSEEGFCLSMSEEIGREVKLLEASMELPETLNRAAFMANIGLLVQYESLGKHIGPSVVSMNTLPLEYQPQPVSSLNILKMLSIVFAILFIFGLGFLIQNTLSGIDTKKNSLNSARLLLTQRQEEATTLSGGVQELESRIAEIQTMRTNLESALSVLELRTIGLNKDIEVTFDEKPYSIWVNHVLHENNILTISGVAPNEKTVLAYYMALDESERFNDIELTMMDQVGNEVGEDEEPAPPIVIEEVIPVMEFTLTASVKLQSDWVSSMEIILGSLPYDMIVDFAVTEDNELSITGNFINESLLLDYLLKLDESGKFSEVNIDSVVFVPEDASYNFDIRLRVGETIDEHDGDGAAGE